MPGPYTTFEAQDPAGAAVSASNMEIASLSLVAGNSAFSADNAQLTNFGSLSGFGGSPVPVTGQMFPSRTA